MDDRRSGRGVQSYVDAKAGGQVVERFDGDWLDGKMHGAGRYVYILEYTRVYTAMGV